MAQIINNFNHAYFFNALDTYNYTMINGGPTTVSVKLTDTVAPNGLTVTIKKNGTTIATSTATPLLPNEFNLSVLTGCLSSDAISVIVASSAGSDTNPNVIKGTITISPNV